MDFGARHAEGIFVVGLSPELIAPRIKELRAKAAEFGRDPNSLKVFSSMTPIIGRTREEAEQKYLDALQYASEEGGLVYWCGNTHIDLGRFDPDQEIKEKDIGVSNSRIESHLAILAYKGEGVPKWTPRNIGKAVALGASGPVPVGTPQDIADEMERWMEVADVDGFNVGHITTPGTWEDVVELLVPELRRRGIYAPHGDSGTMRERFYGQGQSRLRDDHTGAKYRYQHQADSVIDKI
jgi:alkanesulfonate monooxygenase SsuD/methylene tetrahydromethanopterin reductase-like flavin-dependent oxidoreductase (luciferase family)